MKGEILDGVKKRKENVISKPSQQRFQRGDEYKKERGERDEGG